MMYGKHRSTRSTTLTDPIIGGSRAVLRKAGCDNTPLSKVRFEHNGATYTAADLVMSHPYLMAASAGVRLRERSQRIQAGMTVDQHLRAQAELRCRELHESLQQRTFKPEPPRFVEIPKLKFDGDISLETLASLWGPQLSADVAAKPRTLTIDSPGNRILSGSLTMVAASYLHRRWPNCVVGCRYGVGIPAVLAALDQAVRSTGRCVVLAADIEGFFDRIKFDFCRRHLEHALRPDDRFLELFDLAMSTRRDPQEGVPQGNPISPLLANLFGTNAVDPICRQEGPFLRYVDDLTLLVPTVRHATAIQERIQERALQHGLSLHRDKTVVVDLRQGGSFDYLGVRVRLRGGGGLSFHLPNQSIRRLFEGLRDIWFAPADGEEHQRTMALKRFESARFGFIGWLQAYGFCEWTDQQVQAVEFIMGLARLKDATLHGQVEELQQLHVDEQDREKLVQAFARLCRMPRAGQQRRPTDLLVWGDGIGLAELRAIQTERFQTALKRPVDLPYGQAHGGHWRHTAAQQTWFEEAGAVVDDGTELLPSPTAELARRFGRPDNEDGRFPSAMPLSDYWP